MSADPKLLALLRSPGSDPEAARAALHSLSSTIALDRLEELLVDPAVLGHAAAGVRRDAACALGMLGTRHPAALIELLDDEDFAVARAAWLSLWMLTGHRFGLEQDDIFQAIPTAVAEIEHVRDGLFTRPGVSAAQRVAVDAMIRDDLRRADAARRFRELIESRSSRSWAPGDV